MSFPDIESVDIVTLFVKYVLVNDFLHVLLVWCGRGLGNDIESEASSDYTKWKSEHNRIVSQVLSIEETSTFRPHHHSTAVVVECFILLQSFGEINALSMDYTVDIDLYLRWNDERLRHNATTIVFQTVESIKKFWLPDLYFENEKNGALHSVLSENIALLLEPNGDIIYSTRLTLKLSCQMDFHEFPLDMQFCRMKIKSYAYNNNHVILAWSPGQPIRSDGEAKMPQYRLTNISTWVQSDMMPIGNFSMMLAEFRLERSLGYFLINLFLPALLLVIISWISFWLHVDATAARASLGITSVLTLVTQAGNVRHIIPSLSYPTAMDVWFSVSMCFVFGALVEFSMVNYFYILSVRASKRELASGVPEDIDTKNDSLDTETPIDGSNSFHGFVNQGAVPRKELRLRPRKEYDVSAVKSKKKSKDEICKRRSRVYLKIAERIDMVCRFLFPGVFIIFGLVFWVQLSNASGGIVTL
ncbi:glycine receptor subunit alphaZ1-like [Glandiceps talaboti]